jgi:cell division transport system permease protein
MNFLRTIEVLAVSLLALVLVATAGVVAFVARAGLSIHRRIVEIVHLVGAHDSYVARQFQAQAFRYGFVGALIGTLLAAATLVTAGIFAARGAAPIGAAMRAFEPWMIWPLALIPLAAVLIAMVTVRLAVLQALRRMAY